jgi:20S proteasome alpha/beta subunit
MSENEAIKLAYDVITKTEKEKKESSLDIAIIKSDKFRRLTEEEIKRALK